MTSETKTVREIFSAEEISVIDLAKLVYKRRKYIGYASGVFLVIGILIAVTSPIEYSSEARILSESGNVQINSSISALGGLAGLAGLQGPGADQTPGLSPEMYPEIVESEPFLLDLMVNRFSFQEKGKEMSLEEYFLEERPGHIFSKFFGFLKGIPSRFFSLFERKKEWDIPTNTQSVDTTDSSDKRPLPRIVNLSGTQRYVIDQLAPRIDVEAEGKMITLIVKMPEPMVSAQLNSVVLDEIMQYVIAYKTEKQRDNLRFIQERYQEAEGNFKKAQLRLADFRDSNQGIISQRAKAEEDRLQAEFNLAFDLYNQLAQQLEQTKIQLKQDTPLFTEFEPVTIPLSNSEPNVPVTIIKWTALGVFMGALWVFILLARAFIRGK